jgi:hypothetical protein
MRRLVLSFYGCGLRLTACVRKAKKKPAELSLGGFQVLHLVEMASTE